MIDWNGKQCNTVGDYVIRPEWIAYTVAFKAWLKSMTHSDWTMLQLKETIQKHTPKNQMVLPMIGDFDRPTPPTVPISILKPENEWVCYADCSKNNPDLNPEEELLWDADPNCEHDVVCASGGGVKCTKCTGRFCY